MNVMHATTERAHGMRHSPHTIAKQTRTTNTHYWWARYLASGYVDLPSAMVDSMVGVATSVLARNGR